MIDLGYCSYTIVKENTIPKVKYESNALYIYIYIYLFINEIGDDDRLPFLEMSIMMWGS